MTTAREIKKTLNAHFKAQGQKIKFSVTTDRVSCSDRITVKWTGGAFEDEVWEVVKHFHTVVNKSDSMTDYFHITGVDVRLSRCFDDADLEFIQNYVSLGLDDNQELEIYWDNYEERYYVYVLTDGERPWRLDGQQSCWITQYNKTGAIAEYAYIPEIAEEIEKPECVLLDGDEVDETKPYVIIHWAEGFPLYKEEAKFSSFASAHQALLNIWNINHCGDMAVGYTKIKFSIVYPDGEIYGGRLDMSPREDDPTKTDNLIKTHCMEHLDWLVEEGRQTQSEINIWLAKYGFDDNKTQQDNEMLKTKEELLEVMRQMKEYLDIQIEILMNFEPEKQPERLQSLDQEFGIELLKRRKDKLQKRIMEYK